MKKKTFTLPLLNLITSDKKTQEILDRVEPRQKLDFVRQAILDFAIKQGFRSPLKCPVYVPDSKWRKIQKAEAKKRSVSYVYVIAYFWLRSLPEFSYMQKSEIIRQAIKAYQDL